MSPFCRLPIAVCNWLSVETFTTRVPVIGNCGALPGEAPNAAICAANWHSIRTSKPFVSGDCYSIATLSSSPTHSTRGGCGRPKFHPHHLTRSPQSHSWAPCPGAATNNRRHSIDFITASQQQISYLNEIIKWLNLTIMCVV